jgi:5-oxoprolinase (ATP-hydrolysing)
VYAELPCNPDGTPGGYRVLKLLSEDPASYSDAPREAIRRVLESVTGIPHPIDQPLDTSRVESIRMGTTVATNALLERKGERTAFVVTKGFKDLLHIGNQSRSVGGRTIQRRQQRAELSALSTSQLHWCHAPRF